MRLQSLISKAFKERQYMCAYLKQMHELLKDLSERTLAVEVDHAPPCQYNCVRSRNSGGSG